MKILQIRNSLHGGGAERVVVDLSSEMVEQEHCVTIFLTSNVVDYTVNDHVEIIVSTIPKSFIYFENLLKRILGSVAYLFTSWVHVHYLKKSCNIKSFDKIYIHSISSLLPFAALRGRNVYAVYHCAKGKLLLESRNKLSKIKNKLILKWSSLKKNNIAVSKGVANDLKISFSIDIVGVVYNPFDIEEIYKKSKCDIDLNKFGRFILNIGRLDYQKNQYELLDAFKDVYNNYDSLLILGDGVLRDKLERYSESLGISDKVFFLGFVSNPFAYMRQADVFVLTSRFEGFGNVLIESLIAGCPVISSDCDFGPREILSGELSNYLYLPGDKLKLVQILRDFERDLYPIKEVNFNQFSKSNSCKTYLNL